MSTQLAHCLSCLFTLFTLSKMLKLSYSSCLFLYCFIAVISLINLPFLLAGNNETDRLALLEIKAKISHDPLGVMSSWNDTLHFCNWYGVTCGHRHRRVTALDLHSSQLTGTISPNLGNLSFLRELHLENNSFTGMITPEIGRLHRLKELWLNNNSIEGKIPSNLSNCYSLTLLRLTYNRLVGGIPPTLGSMLHLQHLSLGGNNLTGDIPSSLGNLSSLFYIGLTENNLVGSIPHSLGKLKKLEKLLLYNNKFSGVVPASIFNLSSLTVLDLTENDLEGNLPSDLGNTMPRLQWFSIGSNKFTGHIPNSMSNSSNLQALQLFQNNLQGQVPSLHKLLRLKHLLIDNNFLGYGQAGDLIFFSSLANATALEALDIGRNNFKGDFLRTICNSTTLSYIDVSNNYLTGEIPNCIENMSNLQSFAAYNNSLSGVIPQGIGKLVNITALRLHGNLLSGVIPPSIGNSTKLSILVLDDNNLVGQIPSTLGNCRSLTALSLKNNSLRGLIPPQLFSLPALSILLDLSINNLIGILPEEVGQLQNLGSLDVSQNMLSGMIPSLLGSCVSLELLDMSGNYFQGTIPDSLSSLKALVELNLSYNYLSGEIPKYLPSFQLQVLDISHNNFEGKIPVGGVFSNATGLSISGNSRLCGGIPKLKLPPCSSSRNTKKKLVIAILSGIFGVILPLALLVLSYNLWRRKKTKKPTTSGDTEKFPNLSYQTLLTATNGFSSENLIGSGTFGAVYKGILDEVGSTVAIKIFNLEYRGASKSFMAECGVLRSIRHRNLLKVLTACSSIDYQGRDFKALVYEYMASGSLEDWLHPVKETHGSEGTNDTSRKLNLCQRLEIAVDVASSLDYLHHHCGVSIVHCDLKPNNVLLDDEMVAHVGDFGLAKFLPKGIHNSTHANQSSSIGVRGTIGYAPPEYGMGNEVSTCGDVYSFGILILEMFTGKRPYDDMLKGDLSLRGFVEDALPDHVLKILDKTIREELEEIDNNEMDSSAVLEGLSYVLEIALSCSIETPRERLGMSEVAAKLSSTKNKILRALLQQQRRIE